jgi:4-amino-4-deoxy-L-arabinose transferase-like glycosyltransferase
MEREGPSIRLITVGAALLLFVMIFVRVNPLTLSGIDGACYANIAADLAARPFSNWLDVQWMDGPFYEHPPLGLWLEGAWFSIFGSSAVSAVWLARVYASLLAMVVWWGARSLSGPLDAAFSLVGLATLASFQRETQNPMLEAPLMLACAVALVSLMRMRSSKRWVIGFAVAATAAVWIKGIVGLALLGGLGWAFWSGTPWRRLLAAVALFAGLVVVSFASFEALRLARGLGPYLAPYFQKHVMVAFSEGRHSHDPDPFFHLHTLVHWHLSAVLAVPLLAWRWRSLGREQKQLALLGLGWIVAVVLPFSLAQQKSEWHLNVLIPGAAWLLGVSLAALPRPLVRLAPVLLLVASAGWVVLELRGTNPQNHRQLAINALTTTPASLGGASVANCSVLTPWVSKHLFAFHWQAVPVECEAPAPWRFDGRALHPFQK